MIQIFHISDLHFGKDFTINVPGHTDNVKKLLRGVHRLMNKDKHKQSQKYLLITGDIVDDGKNHEYDMVKEDEGLSQFLLNPPPGFKSILLVPGNHDYGTQGNAYSENASTRFEELATALNVPPSINQFGYQFRSKRPHVIVLEDENNVRVLSIGLNSCKWKGLSDFARGEIGEDQLDEFNKLLNKREYADCWKLVYLHHRPYDVKRKLIMELEDAAGLTKITEPIVDVIAYGHQGKMEEPAGDSPAQMSVVQKKGPGDHTYYPLDANKSVKEQACYVITFDRPYDGRALKEPEMVLV